MPGIFYVPRTCKLDHSMKSAHLYQSRFVLPHHGKQMFYPSSTAHFSHQAESEFLVLDEEHVREINVMNFIMLLVIAEIFDGQFSCQILLACKDFSFVTMFGTKMFTMWCLSTEVRSNLELLDLDDFVFNCIIIQLICSKVCHSFF